MPSPSARHASTAAHRALNSLNVNVTLCPHNIVSVHPIAHAHLSLYLIVMCMLFGELKFPTDNHQRIGLIAEHRFAQTKWAFDFHHPYSTTVTGDDGVWRCSHERHVRDNGESAILTLEICMCSLRYIAVSLQGAGLMVASTPCCVR